MAKVKYKAQIFLEPRQAGVATTGGDENVIHSAGQLLDVHGSDDSFAMILVDLDNTFNPPNLVSFMHAFLHNFPFRHNHKVKTVLSLKNGVMAAMSFHHGVDVISSWLR